MFFSLGKKRKYIGRPSIGKRPIYFCFFLLKASLTVSFGRLTPLATVTGSRLLLAPCAADSTVRYTAGPAADTLDLLANLALSHSRWRCWARLVTTLTTMSQT